MPTYTSLRGITDIGDSTVSLGLKENLLGFYKWGFANIGSFFNISVNQSGAYGGDKSLFKSINDPNYMKGQVWGSYRQDWVYETGLDYPISPIRVSGIYVNNNFYPTGTTGPYGYHLDYPHGRIIFNNPIPTGSVVRASYSHRYFSFYAVGGDALRTVDFNSLRVDDNHFLQHASGDWALPAQLKLQLPAVLFTTVPRRLYVPYEIGNNSNFMYQDVLFDIYAESDTDRDKVVDILTNQIGKVIQGFDRDSVVENQRYPLDYNGDINISGYMYPELVDSFFWKRIRFINTSLQSSINRPPLYFGSVRKTCELFIP